MSTLLIAMFLMPGQRAIVRRDAASTDLPSNAIVDRSSSSITTRGGDAITTR